MQLELPIRWVFRFSLFQCKTCACYSVAVCCSVLQCVAVCFTVFGSIVSLAYISCFPLHHMIFCDPHFMLVKLYSSNLYIQKHVYTNLVYSLQNYTSILLSLHDIICWKTLSYTVHPSCLFFDLYDMIYCNTLQHTATHACLYTDPQALCPSLRST